MYLLVMFILIYLFVMLIEICTGDDRWFGTYIGWPFALSAVTTGLAFVIALLISVIAAEGFKAPMAPVETTELPIIALEDRQSYVRLSRYNAEEELKYTYLYKTDKGVTANSVKAESSYINYTSNKPSVKEVKMEFANPILRFINPFIDYYTEYYFYIPEGSIITENNYNIDLH